MMTPRPVTHDARKLGKKWLLVDTTRMRILRLRAKLLCLYWTYCTYVPNLCPKILNYWQIYWIIDMARSLPGWSLFCWARAPWQSTNTDSFNSRAVAILSASLSRPIPVTLFFYAVCLSNQVVLSCQVNSGLPGTGRSACLLSVFERKVSMRCRRLCTWHKINNFCIFCTYLSRKIWTNMKWIWYLLQ